MAETATPRLMAAAKEFNIGKDTLVDFLTGKGFSKDDLKPTSKLTEDMYRALQQEFQGDKVAKLKSDQIDLPKGVAADLKKKKDEEEILLFKKEEKKPVKKEEPKEEVRRHAEVAEIDADLIRLISDSINDLADEEGYVFLGVLGNLILKKQPDFDSRNYGYKKLVDIIKKIPSIEIDERRSGKNHVAMYVRTR